MLRACLSLAVSPLLTVLGALPSPAAGPPVEAGPVVAVASATPRVQRIGGPNHYATAANLSAAVSRSSPDVVYVVAENRPTDAAVAGAVAKAERAPVLVTSPTSLPAETATELHRLQPSSVVVVGGGYVVAPGVLTTIQNLTGVAPTRIWGTSRYEVALRASAARFAPGVREVMVAADEQGAGALLAGAAAGLHDGPVLLTPSTGVPPALDAELRRLRPGRITLVAGTPTIPDAVLQKLGTYAAGGAVRVHAPAWPEVAPRLSSRHFAPGVATAVLVPSEQLRQGLGAVAAASAQGGPLLLTRAGTLPAETAAELSRLRPQRILVLGPRTTVSDTLLTSLHGYLGRVAPLAWTMRYTAPAGTTRTIVQPACADASSCFAIDGERRGLARWTGSAWASLNLPVQAYLLDCAPGFCLAVTTDSRYVTWSAGRWSAPRAMPGRPGALSCPVAGWCVASTDAPSGTRTHREFTAGTWVTGATAFNQLAAQEVACASPTLCLALDLQPTGHVVRRWNGSRWSPAMPAGWGDHLACARSICWVMDDGPVAWFSATRMYTVSPPPWGVDRYVPFCEETGVYCTDMYYSSHMACPADDLCVVASSLYWRDRGWYPDPEDPTRYEGNNARMLTTAGQRILGSYADGALNFEILDRDIDVACASERFCLAVATDGTTGVGTR